MYLAGRSNLTLMGKTYKLGDPVDISEVPLRKVGSLARLGLIVQSVTEVPETPVEVTAEAEGTAEVEAQPDDNSGDLCPLCGEGPFMNMKIHTARMHKEEPDG